MEGKKTTDVEEKGRITRVEIKKPSTTTESVRVGDGVDCSRDYWFDVLRDGWVSVWAVE